MSIDELYVVADFISDFDHILFSKAKCAVQFYIIVAGNR